MATPIDPPTVPPASDSLPTAEAPPPADLFANDASPPAPDAPTAVPATDLYTLDRDPTTLSEEPWTHVSSFNPHSNEVKSMAQQIESGKGVEIYEFQQGMQDYHQGGELPARTYLLYPDGRRIPHDGKTPIDRDRVTVEFFNVGPGLEPADTVAIRHGGGEETLGTHGRGTSVSLTYLASQGMTVEIESNADDLDHGVKGRAWTGATRLDRTKADRLKLLHVDGKWLPRNSNETRFRVLNPTKTFLDNLERVGHFFLLSNPSYPGATLVQPSPDAKPPCLTHEVALRTPPGRIECLEGLIAHGEDEQPTVFVDGLRLNASYGTRTLFPWAFWGLREMPYPLCLNRSHDSSMVTGGNVEDAIQLALSHNRDRGLFEKLLDASFGPRDELPLELKTPSWSVGPKAKMEPESQALLRAVWDARAPGCIIVRDETEQRNVLRESPDTKVQVVGGAMFGWLQDVGVADGQSVLGGAKIAKVASGQEIRVAYAEQPDRLERLLQEAVEARGRVSVIQLSGRKALEVRFPYSIDSKDDFHDRQKPGAQWVRVASVVADKEALSLEVISQTPTVRSQLTFETTPGWPRDRFQTKLEVRQRDLPPPEGETDSLFTRVRLSGEGLEGLAPPGAEGMVAVLQEQQAAAEAEEARLKAELPVLIRPVKTRKAPVKEPEWFAPKPEEPPGWERVAAPEEPSGLWTRRGALLSAGAALVAAAVGFERKPLLQLASSLFPPERPVSTEDYDRSYGSLGLGGGGGLGGADGLVDHGAVGVQREPDYHLGGPPPAPLTGFRSGPLGDDVSGYYREFVGTRFIRDDSRRGRFVSIESYDDVEVGASADRYATEITLSALHGSRRVPIRAGDRIVAASGNAKLKREHRTGDYVATGEGEVRLLTRPGDPDRQPPLQEESAPLVDSQALPPDWRALLGYLQQNASLSTPQRAAMVLDKWSSGFTYLDDPAYDVLATGSSAPAIVSNVIDHRVGLCNFATLGLVALMRAAAIPARQVGGKTVDGVGDEGPPHAWAEIWNGERWQELEPLIHSLEGRRRRRDDGDRSRTDQYLDSVTRSAQSEATRSLFDDNARLLKEHAKLLANPARPALPPTTAPPTPVRPPVPAPAKATASAPVDPMLLHDTKLVVAGALAGAAATRGLHWWNERKRGVAAEKQNRS